MSALQMTLNALRSLSWALCISAGMACAGPGPDGAPAGADGAAGGGVSDGSAGPTTDAEVIPNPDPPDTWVNVTGNLADMPSECGNLSFLSAKPGENLVIAGVAQQGLWATRDGGTTWERMGAGAGSETITNRPSAIVYDPADPDVFWESGIYDGGGVYTTRDHGATFDGGWLHHNDLVSVDFGDPERRTLLASGHEQARTLSLSGDGGATWDEIGDNLPAGTNFSSAPLVLDRDTFLVGCEGWGGGTSGIYRSTDRGESFDRVSELGSNAAPLVAADGSIYWSRPYGAGLMRSTDRGATWSEATGGGIVAGITPVELPDGRLATIGGRRLVISDDHGATWSPIGPALPFDPAVLTYSTVRRAFYVSQWDCGDRVLPDAIWRYYLG